MNDRTFISADAAGSEGRPFSRLSRRSFRFASASFAALFLLFFLAGCSALTGTHGDDLYGVGDGASQSGEYGKLDTGADSDAYGSAGGRGGASGSGLSRSSRRSGADVYGSARHRSKQASAGGRTSRSGELYLRRRQAAPSHGGRREGAQSKEDIFGSAETGGEPGGSEVRSSEGRDEYRDDRLGKGAGRDKESPARAQLDGEADVYGVSGERKRTAAQERAVIAAAKPEPKAAPAPAPSGPGLPLKPEDQAAAPAPAGPAAEGPTAVESPKQASPPVSKPEEKKAPLPVSAEEKKTPLPAPPVPSSEPSPAAVPAPAAGGKPAEAPTAVAVPAAAPPAEKPPAAPALQAGEPRPPGGASPAERPSAESPAWPPEQGVVEAEAAGVTVLRGGKEIRLDKPGTGPSGTAGAEAAAAGPPPDVGERELHPVARPTKGPRIEQDMVGVVEDLYRGSAASAGPDGRTLRERDRGAEADLYGRKQRAAAVDGRVEGAKVEGASDDYNVSTTRGIDKKGLVVINRPPNINGLTGLLITNSAYSMEAGKRVAGVAFTIENSDSPKFRVMQMPITLTFGIAKDVEIGVKAKVVDIYNETPYQDERGFGDTEVSLKWHFVKEGIILPDLAVGAAGILPMASEQRGLNEVMDWGLKLMVMASSEKRITEKVVIAAYLEAQAVFIDELFRGGSTPGAERYGILNVGLLFPFTGNDRLQLIAEHNQVLYKTSYQPTLLEGNQGMTTAAVRFVTKRFNLTAGAQYINKEKNTDDNTIRFIGTMSYPF